MHTRAQFSLRGNRGAAYVLALVTVLVGTVLALAMLQAGNSYFLSENSRAKKSAAMNMAQAGVEYAYWQVHYGGRPLPYSADVTLSTGSFHVDATDDGNRDLSTMLIIATGTCGGRSHTIKRVTLGLLPYHYAWCERTKIIDGDTIISTSYDRGMRSNDDISLASGWNNITTGLFSTGTISSWGTATPQYQFVPPIAFPDIDYSYYSSIATVIYNSNVTLTSLSYLSDGVVVVNGNATIDLWTAKYRGAVTLVATGSITVRSNLGPYDANSYLALMTAGMITVQSSASSVTAVLYAHKPDNNGKVILLGNTTIVGSMSADDVSTTSLTDIRRDPDLDLDIMRRLKVPGL